MSGICIWQFWNEENVVASLSGIPMQLIPHPGSCSHCGASMQLGFLLTRSPIFFMPKERIIAVVHSNLGCDIFRNRWWQKFLPSKARYVMGHHCLSCKILIVDYEKVYTWKEGRELSQRLLAEEKGTALGALP